MGKTLAFLGMILIIVGLLPILATYLATYVDLSSILVYFDQGIFSTELGGYVFTEVMLGLIGFGAILFIIGLIRD